jgi:Domain of unknown function (DUF222)
MGWRNGAGHETGDEPGPGFGPPRRDVHHDAEPDDVAPGAGGAPRDERLAGFAPGGEWNACPPSAELAQVLESVSGADWRCPGATDDEMVGMVRRWAAIESWAGAGKLRVIRELIRREDKPWLPADRHVDQPDPWSESLTHELALALAASAGSADRTEWLAWELGTRLPGIDALLLAGTLGYGKAKAVAEAFGHLSDADAAHAEALILGRLAGKTHLQVMRLAAMAASKVDPEGDERRRKNAEKQSARVRLWREQSGAAALAGFDLPADEALAAHANVAARAEEYKKSGAFPGEKMDQLRAMGYLDLLNGVTAKTRIAHARARASSDNSADPADSAAAAPDTPGGTPGDDCDGGNPGNASGRDDRGRPGNGSGPEDSTDPGDSDPGDGGPDDGGPRDGGPGDSDPGTGGPGGSDPGDGNPDHGQPAGPSPNTAAQPRTDLIIPLATLLGLGNRPGESHQFGPLDPALCRDLAAIAANSPATKLCVTVTDHDDFAIGHGCARPHQPSRQAKRPAHRALTALPARVNLTIPLTDLQSHADPPTAGPASRGSPWNFTPRADDPGPPGGYGIWTLSIPGGFEFTVRLEPVPTFACDHAHESHAYQPNDTLRHLVQVRDGNCTFPPCTRHARESDFEHAIPYDKGGRTCACNAGARSRKCHRIKQSTGWNVSQPKPGFHQWTTPTGRTYTQEPKRYPA